MDNREELVCIFANGRIFYGPDDVTFQLDDVKIISVDQNITLVRLKQVVGQKLQISSNQVVSNIVYRYPTSINPPRYQACTLLDDSDIKKMWRVNSRFSTQLTGAELYAIISNVDVGYYPESQPIEDNAGYTLPSSSNQVDIVEQGSMYNTYLENVQPFEPCPNIGNTGSSSSVHETEDIMDDFEEEDEYDFLINASNDNDDGYDDCESNEETNEGGNDVPNTTMHNDVHEFEEPAAAFFSHVNLEAVVDAEFSGLGEILPFSDNQEFFIGQIFNNVRALRRAVKLYSVRVHHMFKVNYSCKKYEEYRCVNYGSNCSWRLRACKKANRNHWQITKYEGPHSCLSTSLT